MNFQLVDNVVNQRHSGAVNAAKNTETSINVLTLWSVTQLAPNWGGGVHVGTMIGSLVGV